MPYWQCLGFEEHGTQEGAQRHSITFQVIKGSKATPDIRRAGR